MIAKKAVFSEKSPWILMPQRHENLRELARTSNLEPVVPMKFGGTKFPGRGGLILTSDCPKKQCQFSPKARRGESMSAQFDEQRNVVPGEEGWVPLNNLIRSVGPRYVQTAASTATTDSHTLTPNHRALEAIR